MSTTLFVGFQPIDRYNRAELFRQFANLAQATAGKFSEEALNWNFSGSNQVVGNIFRNGFPAGLWIEHDWTVHTSLVVGLPAGQRYEMHFNNIYGGASGVPIVGPPRVESDLDDRIVASLLIEAAYWQLALGREPFALTLSKVRLTLSTYRFYPYEFYLGALDYLTQLADRMEKLVRIQVPVKKSIGTNHLPWVT